MSITPNEKLKDLLGQFLADRLDAQNFSDRFCGVYNLELDYSTLSPLEQKEFRALMVVAARFSPYEEDLVNYDCYFSASQLRQKAEEVYRTLEL